MSNNWLLRKIPAPGCRPILTALEQVMLAFQQEEATWWSWQVLTFPNVAFWGWGELSWKMTFPRVVDLDPKLSFVVGLFSGFRKWWSLVKWWQLGGGHVGQFKMIVWVVSAFLTFYREILSLNLFESWRADGSIISQTNRQFFQLVRLIVVDGGAKTLINRQCVQG